MERQLQRIFNCRTRRTTQAGTMTHASIDRSCVGLSAVLWCRFVEVQLCRGELFCGTTLSSCRFVVVQRVELRSYGCHCAHFDVSSSPLARAMTCASLDSDFIVSRFRLESNDLRIVG